MPAPGVPRSCSPPTCATWRSRPAAPHWCSVADLASPRSTPRGWPARRGLVPTALSSTETGATYRPGHLEAARRAVVDVAILFRLRRQAVRRRHLARVLSLVFLAITLGTAIVPAFAEGAHATEGRSVDVLLLIPSAMAGILVLNMASAVASGGGRELISRDQGAPHPISPTTDHLGALLLAPLNIAWMIQAWVLLGSVAFATPPHLLVQAQIATLLWLVFSTTAGQVVGGGGAPARSVRHCHHAPAARLPGPGRGRRPPRGQDYRSARPGSDAVG